MFSVSFPSMMMPARRSLRHSNDADGPYPDGYYYDDPAAYINANADAEFEDVEDKKSNKNNTKPETGIIYYYGEDGWYAYDANNLPTKAPVVTTTTTKSPERYIQGKKKKIF